MFGGIAHSLSCTAGFFLRYSAILDYVKRCLTPSPCFPTTRAYLTTNKRATTQAHPDEQYSPRPSPTFVPHSSAGLSSHDTSIKLPRAVDEVESDTQDQQADQVPQVPSRPSQNRAAFGKWRSKPISGFAAVDTILPPEISAQEVCESYPNHVNDYTILTLMREGKGAKAIDALIPGPPGKPKAVQSHSKIQLRVSTIREAFPDEDFPITSTKRKRSRSMVPKDEPTSSDDDNVAPTAVGASRGWKGAAARSSTMIIPRTQHSVDHLQDTESDKTLRASDPEKVSALGTFAASDSCPSRIGEPSLRWEAAGTPASSTTELGHDDFYHFQIQLLKQRIRIEYHMHKQLVFAAFYYTLRLPAIELVETVRAHCAAMYDSESRGLQGFCGTTFKKINLNHGESEHALSYLQRSIKMSFERIPSFRARVDPDCPQDHIDRRLEIAVLQESLIRLQSWTKHLESMRETERKTQAHKRLHEAADRDSDASFATSLQQMPLPPSSYLSTHPESSPASVQVFRNHHFDPESGPWTSRTLSPIATPIDRPLQTSVDARFTEELSPTVKGRFEDGCLSEDPALRGRLHMNELEASNRPAVNFASAFRFSNGSDQEREGRGEGFKPSKSSPMSEISDHIMTEAPQLSALPPSQEFETYMEGAGAFVDHEARASNLPSASGKLLVTLFPSFT